MTEQQLGLRERKKQRTKEAIQREALRLFEAQGYEATTIEQIAAAADISPSTFFNYFPSKEDVIIFDPYDPQLIAAFLGRPAGEPLIDTLRQALAELSPLFERDRDLMLLRSRIALSVPELQGRMLAEVERGHELLFGLVAQRLGRDPGEFEVRVFTRMLMGAMWEAMLEWVRQDGRPPLMQLIDQAIDVVRARGRIEPSTR